MCDCTQGDEVNKLSPGQTIITMYKKHTGANESRQQIHVASIVFSRLNRLNMSVEALHLAVAMEATIHGGAWL